MENRKPSVAIAHDYLTQRGGAERVVLAMTRAFPGATIYTTLFDPEATFPEFADCTVVVSPLNRVASLRRNHRAALPLLPWASSRIRIDADVVVCSSSGWSHGFKSAGLRLVYCYSPARWLYDQDNYLGAGTTARGVLLKLMSPLLRAWDKRQAKRADRYLSISGVIRDRVRSTYGRDSKVLPAPIPRDMAGKDHHPLGGFEDDAGEFLLCVSRLLPYKNVDAVIGAMSLVPDRKLVVVGRGPDEARLRAMAPDNVSLVSGLDDAVMRWLYANCLGLVAASYEDFGLTPLEAASLGRPSAVLRAGGYLDTMTAETAEYFDEPSAPEIADAIGRLATRSWDREALISRAELFSEERFIDALRGEVEQLVKDFPKEKIRVS